MIRHHIPLVIAVIWAFGLLLAPVGSASTLWAHELMNAAHAPLFMLLTAAMLLWLRTTAPRASVAMQHLTTFLLVIFVGGAGELAQALLTSDREATWRDLVTDGLGAIIGLGLMACVEPEQRVSTKLKTRLAVPAACLASFAVILPVWGIALAYWQRQHQLPELLTFDSAQSSLITLGSSTNLRVVQRMTSLGSSDTHQALEVLPQEAAEWPGITLKEPWPDWSAYKALEIVVENPNPAALTLQIRIDDVRHNQRYEDLFNQSALHPPAVNNCIKARH